MILCVYFFKCMCSWLWWYLLSTASYFFNFFIYYVQCSACMYSCISEEGVVCLELELHMVVSHHVGAGTKTSGLWKNSQDSEQQFLRPPVK